MQRVPNSNAIYDVCGQESGKPLLSRSGSEVVHLQLVPRADTKYLLLLGVLLGGSLWASLGAQCLYSSRTFQGYQAEI